jgi:uncharacterized protein YihD (DUF1040 family)
MRDSNRIDILIEALREAWKKYPDLRFGQLVESIGSFNDQKVDPYYLEDSQWLLAINKFLEE